KSFRDELKNTKGDGFGPCFVAGMPGTFYGRLFPSNTVHFVPPATPRPRSPPARPRRPGRPG
ncbi:hypothetical protein, partial [Bacillus safensis]|uniref:hypothetical protein n=1 Tax=Bacillus safensis TaxID=561879 RepID=UPI0034D1ACC2